MEKSCRDLVPFLVKLEIQLLGEKILNQKVSQSRLKLAKLPLSRMSRGILPSIKRRAFRGRISPLWGRFQKMNRLKLFKEDFSFKLKEQSR
jgi:hypothetical protein